jgi:hypothetical protein
MKVIAGVLGAVLFFGFGIVQIVAGYQGIDYHLGGIWAALAIAVIFFFRFTLPITIGAFFGAMDVWEWHWAFAALFAAPGLLLAIPAMLALVTAQLSKLVRR